MMKLKDLYYCLKKDFLVNQDRGFDTKMFLFMFRLGQFFACGGGIYFPHSDKTNGEQI